MAILDVRKKPTVDDRVRDLEEKLEELRCECDELRGELTAVADFATAALLESFLRHGWTFTTLNSEGHLKEAFREVREDNPHPVPEVVEKLTEILRVQSAPDSTHLGRLSQKIEELSKR